MHPDHQQHSKLFQDINQIHDDKYHRCPSMICVIIDNIIDFPPNTKLVLVLRCTLSSLLSDLCYALPWSITIVYVKNVVRISPPLMNY